MPTIISLRSRPFQLILPVALILLCSGGSSLLAQQQSAAPTQRTTATTTPDPTQPEAQPSLSVDRDPVFSPDAADNATASPGMAESTTNQSNGGVLKSQGGVYTLHRDVDEVLLNCTVVDDKGQLVRDLEGKDFRVWEDDIAEPIVSFQHQDLPVSLGILIDNSGSMLDKRAAVNTAALDLVRASNPADAEFIVNFSDEAYIDQDLTSDIDALKRGLSHIDSKGTTALYDAVAASADELSNHAKQPKQVLLIITDGEDNASRLNLQQTIRRVQNLGGPVVYSIGLLFGEESRDKSDRAREALQMLSNETGGIAYFPHSMQDVNDIAEQVARDIRNQYTVGYHSSKPASIAGYRTVRVEAYSPNHRKLVVRTRKGYYRGPGQPTPTAQTTATAQ
jgi:VWFA-related protein